MQHGRALAILFTLSLASIAQAVSTSIPPSNQPLSGPTAAIEDLARAYRAMSVDGIEAVLTADYRFHAQRNGPLGFTFGASREDEIQVIRHMLVGTPGDSRAGMARADSVGMSFDGVTQGVDPEHPDSTQNYQVLVVTRAQWGLRMVDGRRMWNTPSLHVFHVVRGDAAVLVAGQTADPERWYIRRWLEDVSGLRKSLGAQKGECGEQLPVADAITAARTPAMPGMLGVRALTNPACAALRVSCDLPGGEPARVDVYDVSGRLVNSRQLVVKGPGNVTVDAGTGTRLLPGVYWVRLAQAARTPSTRMVVVAR